MVSNEDAIRTWGSTPTEYLASLDPDGGFAKRHLINPHLLRLLGDVDGRRVLDAGCGQGYFARMLASRGAHVIGVEPGESLFAYAVERERELGHGIEYVQRDLAAGLDLGTFDAVVASMVLCAIPDWQPAMRTCVEAVRPGGMFVFSLIHPCFEELAPTWRSHGEHRTSRYLTEYEIPGVSGVDFHRPLSTYLNELSALGMSLTELVEPALPPEAIDDPELTDRVGASAYLDLPNFVIVAARRTA